MGRKIPGKKHRGVKDPFAQQAKRQAELETKINAPPKDVNEQAVPKSLERVMRLKEAVKSGKIPIIKKKKKKKKSALICVGAGQSRPLHPKAKPDKVVPIFKQKPGESVDHFIHRVGRDTNAFLNETVFEKKYGIQVNRNPDSGNITNVSKRKKNVLDDIEMLRLKHKNIKKKKESMKPKMTKDQRKKQKLRLKKQKKDEENKDGFDTLKDRVGFGEVVHEPPNLRTRPKKADAANSAKPGKKDLLLNSMLAENKVTRQSSKKHVAIDRSGKRKNLPAGERRQLEEQQSSVIAAYRKLRAQQSAASHS